MVSIEIGGAARLADRARAGSLPAYDGQTSRGIVRDGRCGAGRQDALGELRRSPRTRPARQHCSRSPPRHRDAIFERIATLPMRLEPNGAVGLAVVMGLVIFATTTALIHLRPAPPLGRARSGAARRKQRAARPQRPAPTCSSPPSRRSSSPWRLGSGEPDIEGDLSLVADVAAARRPLAFGSLAAGRSRRSRSRRAVERLKRARRGLPHDAEDHRRAAHLEAEGRAVDGPRRAAHARRSRATGWSCCACANATSRRCGRARSGCAPCSMRCPQPAWLRDAAGQARLGQPRLCPRRRGRDGADAVERGEELLDKPIREDALRSRHAATACQGARHRRGGGRTPHASTCSTSRRRRLGAASRPTCRSSRPLRAELRPPMSHAATLDQLPTAVAIFDRAKRLRFCNSAYAQALAARSRLPRQPSQPTARSSTACATPGGCPSRPTSAPGRAAFWTPTSRSSPRDALVPAGRRGPCASSATPIREAASPTCSTT